MLPEAGIFSLRGKSALITGATGHLGTEMALAVAGAGAKVFINSRTAQGAESLVSRLSARGCSAEIAVFDVTDKTEVKAFATTLRREPLHVLVNNAYAGGSGGVELSEDRDYVKSYEVAVVAAQRLVKALLPNLRLAASQSGDASVINVASMYALVSPDHRVYRSAEGVNPPYYGAAKAALLQWVRYAACEFGRENIRFNAVSPGPFPSQGVVNHDPEFVSRLAAKVPMGRIGAPSEIAGPILFLASTGSSYVNGANLVVDGGWTCW